MSLLLGFNDLWLALLDGKVVVLCYIGGRFAGVRLLLCNIVAHICRKCFCDGNFVWSWYLVNSPTLLFAGLQSEKAVVFL